MLKMFINTNIYIWLTCLPKKKTNISISIYDKKTKYIYTRKIWKNYMTRSWINWCNIVNVSSLFNYNSRKFIDINLIVSCRNFQISRAIFFCLNNNPQYYRLTMVLIITSEPREQNRVVITRRSQNFIHENSEENE